jgi:hypothetical protein
LGYNGVESQPTFWKNTSPPTSGMNCKPRKKYEAGSQKKLLLAARLIFSFETSVDFQGTTWPYIPDDVTLQNEYISNEKKPVHLCILINQRPDVS